MKLKKQLHHIKSVSVIFTVMSLMTILSSCGAAATSSASSTAAFPTVSVQCGTSACVQ